MMARKKVLPVLVCLCALVAARADQSFTINLDGSQETPPNASTGSGSGTAFFDSTALTITLNVNFIDLLDAATAAHIHDAPPGVPGGIIVDFSAFTPAADAGNISGTLAFPAANVADLLAGNTYLNIHTAIFPSGEIRGQLVAIPEPATVLLVGLGLVALAFARRRRAS